MTDVGEVCAGDRDLFIPGHFFFRFQNFLNFHFIFSRSSSSLPHKDLPVLPFISVRNCTFFLRAKYLIRTKSVLMPVKTVLGNQILDFGCLQPFGGTGHCHLIVTNYCP